MLFFHGQNLSVVRSWFSNTFIALTWLSLAAAYLGTSLNNDPAWYYRFRVVGASEHSDDHGLVANVIREITNGNGLPLGGMIEGVRSYFAVLIIMVLGDSFTRESRWLLFDWRIKYLWPRIRNFRRWRRLFRQASLKLVLVVLTLGVPLLDAAYFHHHKNIYAVGLSKWWSKSSSQVWQENSPTIQQEINSLTVRYWAYQPYAFMSFSLMGAMITIGSLGSLNDLRKLSFARRRVVAEIERTNLRLTLERDFSHFRRLCGSVCTRHLNLWSIILLSATFEIAIGRYTLSDSGIGNLIKWWICGLCPALILLVAYMLYDAAFQRLAFHASMAPKWRKENGTNAFMWDVVSMTGLASLAFMIISALCEFLAYKAGLT